MPNSRRFLPFVYWQIYAIIKNLPNLSSKKILFMQIAYFYVSANYNA